MRETKHITCERTKRGCTLTLGNKPNQAQVKVAFEGDEAFALEFSGKASARDWAQMGLRLNSTANRIIDTFDDLYSNFEDDGVYGSNDRRGEVYARVRLSRGVSVITLCADEQMALDGSVVDVRLAASGISLRVTSGGYCGPRELAALGSLLFEAHRLGAATLGMFTKEDLHQHVVEFANGCLAWPEGEG